jgi:hypothetical protein
MNGDPAYPVLAASEGASISQTRPSAASMSARLSRLLAMPAVVGAGALLVGCGGSSSPSKAAAAEQQAETQFAHFAKCLREHGVNAEVQSRPGGAHGLKIMPGSGGPATMEAAEKACARYRLDKQTGSHFSPQQKAEQEEALQKLAKCMREHGIEAEASTAGGIEIHGAPGSGGPNPASPAFQRAQRACHKLLPGREEGSPRGG